MEQSNYIKNNIKTQSVSNSLTTKTSQNKAITLEDNRPASLLQRKANHSELTGQPKSGVKISREFQFSTDNPAVPVQLMFGAFKGAWNYLFGTPAATPTATSTATTTVAPPLGITRKKALAEENKRNKENQKRKRLEAIWENQGVIFHVHKPNANLDPDWILNFNDIRNIVHDDEGFEFQNAKKAINIKYNFIQLAELFTNVRAHLYNMTPQDLRGDQETTILKCFGTPHFMDSYENKKEALLNDSRKKVTEMDYTHFDAAFGQKPIAKKFNKKKNSDKVNHLLGKDRFEGFIMGENHDTPDSKKFLMNQMANLKKNKVTTLYLEHIRSEYQTIIDEWYAAPALTPMPAKLKTFLKSNDFSNNLKNELHNLEKLVQKAYDNKIKVVGIDSLHAQYDPDDSGGDELRDMTMNAFAQHTIEADKDRRNGGKYVALVGEKHSNTHKARKVGKGGYSQGLPGLSQQLTIPAVKIDPVSKKIVLDKEVKQNRHLV